MNQQMYHHLPEHESQLIAEYAELLVNAKLNFIQRKGDLDDRHLLSD
ncbi:hypothetical protein [Enterococcus avium]